VSVNLTIKLREAYKDAKDIPQLLETHEKKLNSLLNIVDAIDAQDALKTATVTLQLETMCDVVSQIKKFLQTLSNEKEKKHCYQSVESAGTWEEERENFVRIDG